MTKSYIVGSLNIEKSSSSQVFTKCKAENCSSALKRKPKGGNCDHYQSCFYRVKGMIISPQSHQLSTFALKSLRLAHRTDPAEASHFC